MTDDRSHSQDDAVDLRGRVASMFESSDTAAQLVDEHDRLVWTSPQLLAILGLCEAADLAEGRAIGAQAVDDSDWAGIIPGDTADVAAEQLSTAELPVWEFSVEVRSADQLQRLSVRGIRLHLGTGDPAGTALVYSPQLPAQIITMLSRGDPEMFERMAMLTEPARRASAVVFVDIDSSARLSRRLPTQTYFEVIRAVTTAVDKLVTERCGVVGKHAGDGASAFFLAETCCGESSAARAALSFALALPAAVREAVGTLADGGMAVSPDDCRINIGAHWGADLYIGQVVTGGRLEVTALGDEVNEAARIEQAADGGECLASKALVERLGPDDAETIGIDPAAVSYEVLGDRVAADGKIQRDAGTLAITSLTPRSETPQGTTREVLACMLRPAPRSA